MKETHKKLQKLIVTHSQSQRQRGIRELLLWVYSPSMVSYEKLLNVIFSGLCKFTDPDFNSLAFWGIFGWFASEKFPPSERWIGGRSPVCHSAKPLHRQAFSDAIKEWKQQGMLPVLCLDDFESLLKRTEEFDNGFYDNLRSLMNYNALMLVVDSRKELSVYGLCLFFNLGHVLKLGELITDEAI